MTGESARPGVSHRLVLVVLAVSLAIALIFASYVFRRYLRYQPRVQDHLPADYALALRLDVEHAVAQAPFRKHLLPLLRSATGLELGADLRELGVAIDQRGQWLVLLGGLFEPAGMVRRAAVQLEREGAPARLEHSPERLVLDTGAAFGVSGDGVVVHAATDELLLGVLQPKVGAVRFSAGAVLSLTVHADEHSPLAGLEVDVWPGQNLPIELRLPTDRGRSGPRALGPLLAGKTGDFKLFEGTGPWEIEPRAASVTRASAVLSAAEFDLAVAELARSLGRLVGLPREPAQARGAR